MTDSSPQPQEGTEEVVDGVPVADPPPEPAPALREPVAAALENAALTVPTLEGRDVEERGVFVAMDAHDAARLVDRLTAQAQELNLGKRWIYAFKGSDGNWQRGLTVDAVEDITQQMNWTGKCAIGVVPETLTCELTEIDDGKGPQPWWVATVAAEDARTGARMVGTSMEPLNMRLKNGGRRFDEHARGKAIGKAQRNALESFIPEKVKLTLIAMAANEPALVERIESDEEARVREMPPPLDTPEARAKIDELRSIYEQVRELGGGQGAVKLPPGAFGAFLLQSQHSLDRLEDMRVWLLERKGKIDAELKDAA